MRIRIAAQLMTGKGKSGNQHDAAKNIRKKIAEAAFILLQLEVQV